MRTQLKKQIEKYVNNLNERIIISISGGIDSISLLDILIRLNYKNLILVHFNYNIHANALFAEQHIKALSKLHNFRFKIFKTKLSKNNFENIARIDRYKKLNKYAKEQDCNVILTAHHYDDQIETLIMKDATKSDWISYIGIRERYNKILRPMLSIRKEQILLYGESNHLIWFDDNTNNDLSYLRNKIRYNIENSFYDKKYLKYLLMKHKESIKKMIIFDKYAMKYSKNVYKIKNNAILLNKDLNKYFDGVYLKLFLKKIIKEYFDINIELTKSHWNKINTFLKKPKHGTKTIIKDMILMSDRDGFILYNKNFKKYIKKRILKNSLDWYNTSFIVGDKNIQSNNILDIFKCPNSLIVEGLYLMHWNRGDYIKKNNKIKKKVKDIFTDYKVTLYDKKFYPIVKNSKEEIVWIPKLKCKHYKNNALTNIYWIKNEK